jgi:hypothetical protein
MPYPSVQDVQSRYLIKLDDPLQETFKQPYFNAALAEAYDAMYQAFLGAQLPRIEIQVSYIVTPGQTQFTPADAGIADFGDYIFLRERLAGSNNLFFDMIPVDVLSQRAPTDRLIEFNWRNNTFYLIGSTNLIEVQIRYDSSGIAPTFPNAVIGVDACLNFLSSFAAGVSADLKGYTDIAEREMLKAVGPKYASGEIGGYLFGLVSPLVRSRQKVQIAPKPYSAFRRWAYRRATPYVAAQNATTGGGSQNVPVQFSSATGGILGAINNHNQVFVINSGVTAIELVAINGVVLTLNVDYSTLGNQITFITRTPQAGNPQDIITAECFIQ